MSGSDPVGEAFDELVRRADGAMYIVTVAVEADGEVARGGCLVGFATQCSIDPRRFLLCLSVANHTTTMAATAEYVGVHHAPADRFDLAERFGGRTEDDPDVHKFADVSWIEGPHGVPLLDGCPDRFVGRILERFEVGDHVGHLLEPVHAETGPEVAYLGLDRAEAIEPGHPD